MVVTAIGKDRPGLVAGISSILSSINANIEDMDEVVLKNSIFVMSMVVDIRACELPFSEIKRLLIEKGKELKLRVSIFTEEDFAVGE